CEARRAPAGVLRCSERGETLPAGRGPGAQRPPAGERDTARPGAVPERGRPAGRRPRAPIARRRPLVAPFAVVARSEWGAEDLGDFFLHLNDGFGLTQFAAQPLILLFQLPQALPGCRLGIRLAAAGGPQPFSPPLLEKLAPLAQVRGVEPLFAQQGSELSGPLTALGLLDDLELVGGGKLPPLGFRTHFRIHRAHPSRARGGGNSA